MRLSEMYFPTIKDVSSEVVSVSHKYSLRAGLVKQISSGVYAWLPMGLMVMRKIENIIREAVEEAGFSEILMPSIQPADLWKESGRYELYGVEMFRTIDHGGKEMLFGPTHEEVVVDVVRNSVKSYRNLPVKLYQIQWKFRDELRPRHGIMRAREFLMKDAYSFDADANTAMRTYGDMFAAYHKIFKKLYLPVVVVSANSGEIGGSMSHEFHVLSHTGESTLYYDKALLNLFDDGDYSVDKLQNVYSVASDMHDPEKCTLPESDLVCSKGIEVGHVFYLDDRYSKPMKAAFHDQSGSTLYAHMGCYGIGISRLIAAIIEVFHDDIGIKWPECVAPFKIGIVNIGSENEKCIAAGNHIHAAFPNDSLYDDTKDSPGTKLSRMDLFGMPWQVIIGNSFVRHGVLELKNRADGTTETLSVEDLIGRLSA